MHLVSINRVRPGRSLDLEIDAHVARQNDLGPANGTDNHFTTPPFVQTTSDLDGVQANLSRDVRLIQDGRTYWPVGFEHPPDLCRFAQRRSILFDTWQRTLYRLDFLGVVLGITGQPPLLLEPLVLEDRQLERFGIHPCFFEHEGISGRYRLDLCERQSS